ncbi:putative ornithine decarboxylase-like [Apostichopus japonicus]|uniref:Putative ornithine decarboxylase-like n=1 Tax=Stichopus japonicus TaxID=307972 RepID=A0A2G8L867_STIJA|nr:putative ornithine decarboxylase-like [Apostichopus japonicus]
MEDSITVCQDTEEVIDVIRRMITERSLYQNSDDAFYVMDMGYQVKMVDQWKRLLPKVYPYYAVKANPDPVLLQIFAKMNFGFDCASLHEIQTILNLNVQPSRIVLLLRLCTKGLTDSITGPMADKFGCPRNETSHLLTLAKNLDLKVVGVSFHVGSLGATADSAEVYARAIEAAKNIFSEGRALGFDFEILDIGGGFPAKTTVNYSTLDFNEVVNIISMSLDNEFGNDGTFQVIAEPGLQFAMPSTVLVANIIGKRRKPSKGDPMSDESGMGFDYFINDGIFTSFLKYALVPDVTPVVKPVAQIYANVPSHTCRIWGQSCAGNDVVVQNCKLPEMNVGDWLFFTGNGSLYTTRSITSASPTSNPLCGFVHLCKSDSE